MLFTSGPLARNQVVSDLFKKKGALASAPVMISEARTGPVPSTKDAAIILICATFYSYVIGLVYSKAADPQIFANIFTTLPIGFFRFFTTPLMAVSLSRSNETAIHRLTALGFSEQVSGRMKFYVGPSLDSTVKDVTMIEGMIPDCYAPRGYASVHGIMTLEIINRALFLAFRIMSCISTITIDGTEIPTSPIIDENTIHEIVGKGIFFPYFDGLLLADRGSISSFITIFSRCLGKGSNEIKDNVETLYSGWASAANTSGGRAASHAIWCLEKALQGGWEAKPVFLQGEYTGCVLFGKVNFIHLGSMVGPTDAEKLQEEIRSFMTHNHSLEQIAGILSLVGKAPASPDQLTSYRAIHNRLRDVTLSPDQTAELRQHLRGLRFRETTWLVSDSSKVLLAIRALASGEFLPDTAPIYSSPEVLVTKDHAFSTLAAFGPKSFSLVSSATQVSRPWGDKVYTGLVQPGNLTGIPIFAYPLQEATELWKTFLRDHVIKFSHKGKDKMDRLRVKGVDSYIPFDSDESKHIMGVLGACFRSKGKRKAEEEVVATKSGGGDKVDAEARKQKRVKGLGMMFGEGGDAGSFEGDVEMDENF